MHWSPDEGNHRLSAVRIENHVSFCTKPYQAAMTTAMGSLAQPEILNISGSSGASAVLSPTKKQKATPALFGALVATSENVTLHNATAIAVNSSSSGISVVSSAERLRSYEVDLAAFQVAELELKLA